MRFSGREELGFGLRLRVRRLRQVVEVADMKKW